jgi:protocatechuate 3,4-dioxygenase beta subunit
MLALASTRFASAAGEPLCKLTAEQEEGPFYIPGAKLRSDLIEDRSGVPLELKIRLVNSEDCSALRGASIEIWSCDAAGEYAGFAVMPEAGPAGINGMVHDGPPGAHDGPAPGTPPGAPMPHMEPVNQKTFLRGMQRTDGDGVVIFSTLYPGCYAGRTNHVHVKVRVPNRDGSNHVAHTGQIFFPEATTTAVLATDPYSANHVHRTLLAEDMVYTRQSGNQCMAHLTSVKEKDIREGLLASVTFSLDARATPQPVGLPLSESKEK